MDNRKLKITVTIGAIIAGCLVVALWLLLPLPFSPRNQAPVTSKEFFLIKVETELDNMRMLLALRTNMGFIEAQDPAERIRDLCFDMDKKGWEKWNDIVSDINSLYVRLAVEGSASLEEVLDELYAKYPFLELEGVEKQESFGDMVVKTAAAGIEWDTSSTVWQDIPGLLIKQKFEKKNVFIVFEGDAVVVSADSDNGSRGFVRLLINDDELDIKEFHAMPTSGGAPEAESMTLEWRGELPSGEHTIKVQAKVSDSGAKLSTGNSRDIPKLVLIQ